MVIFFVSTFVSSYLMILGTIRFELSLVWLMLLTTIPSLGRKCFSSQSPKLSIRSSFVKEHIFQSVLRKYVFIDVSWHASLNLFRVIFYSRKYFS